MMKKRANTERAIAGNQAKEISYIGQAEIKLAKLLGSKRTHEEKMKHLEVMKSLANNDDVTVFGDHKENILAMLAQHKIWPQFN